MGRYHEEDDPDMADEEEEELEAVQVRVVASVELLLEGSPSTKRSVTAR